MTIKHDNCKNCRSRCIHAGKDRDFVCINGVSCKITTEKSQTNAVTVQEWISVKERLPQEKVNCIVHYKHAYCDNDDYWAIGMCFYDGEKFQVYPAYKVTHWMPMPQPPKGE